MINLNKLKIKRDYLATRIGKGGASAPSIKRLAELNKELLEASVEAAKVMGSLNMAEEWVLEQYKQHDVQSMPVVPFTEEMTDKREKYQEFYCR